MKRPNALLTGGAGNLGRQFCLFLLKNGFNVLLVDKNRAALDGLFEAIPDEFKSSCRLDYCDLEIEKERDRLIGTVMEKSETLDCLINNAAFNAQSHMDGWMEEFSHQSTDAWRRAFEINVTAPFHLSRDLAPLLKRSDNANIVNISSIYGQLGPRHDMYVHTELANPAAYGASKAALEQLTRWLAATLGPKVRVNALALGGIYRRQPHQFVDKYISHVPMGRMAREEDMISALSFIISRESKYLTGQIITVDGGYGIW